MRFSPKIRSIMRWLITSAALAYVFWAISQHEIWRGSVWLDVLLHPSHPVLMAFVIVGMPVNVGIEVLKWHALTGGNMKPWRESIREVLVGSMFGMITPNRTGDAIARVTLLPKSEQKAGARAWAYGAWAQSLWTLTFGMLAFFILCFKPQWTWGHSLDKPLFIPVGIFGMLLTIGWWALPRLITVQRFRIFQRWFAELGEPLSSEQRIKQIAWSGLRYIVFTLQFFLALKAWGMESTGPLLAAIPLVYLGNMLIPSAALAELGIREALMVAWIQPDDLLLPHLITATFFIWLINLCVPALAGGVIQLMHRDD